MKTTNEILTDIVQVVEASPIFALAGDTYKKTRPTDSKLEDCVVSIFPGTTEKFIQDGAIYIKIFYQDINEQNSYYEDTLNGQTKEQLLMDLSETLLSMNGYSFEIQSRELYTERVEEIHQHFAILKMNFLLTNN